MKSDFQVQSDVENELAWQPYINSAHIGVTAADGVVTLSGQVDYYTEKEDAERAAKRVYGVKAVVNDIEVELADSSRRTDTDIAAAAVSALKWNILVPINKVTVTVRDGWVTLEGKVDWQYQSNAAQRCAQRLMGVKGVTNSIIINSKPTPKGIKVKIEDAFKRNADLNARRIAVTTENGKVTLSGSVSSWSERDEAESAAWAAPGVTSVDDQLTVMP
jgi:osmotically-inducible protein OsmY